MKEKIQSKILEVTKGEDISIQNNEFIIAWPSNGQTKTTKIIINRDVIDDLTDAADENDNSYDSYFSSLETYVKNLMRTQSNNPEWEMSSLDINMPEAH